MIARKTALIVTSEILSGALAYISLFFITKYSSTYDYGIVAFAIGFISLFEIFGNLGFNHSHVKKVSEGKDIGKCIGTFIVIKLFLLILSISLILLFLIVWVGLLNRGFESQIHLTAVYVAIGHLFLKLLSQPFITTYRAKKEIAKMRVSSFLQVIVRVFATVLFVINGYGALAILLAYILGDIAFFILSIYFFKGYHIKKPNIDLAREYTHFAIPLVLVVASGIMMQNVDKVLIQLFWNADDLGNYFAAFNLTKFVSMFTSAVVLLLFPTYSYLHSSKNIENIKKLTHKSERFLSMIVFPMVFGIVILANPATKILLSGWTEAAGVLQILPFFVLFAALEGPYQSQLLGMNKPKLARNRVIIMVTINIILNMILIPYDIKLLGIKLFGLGIRGAAISTVIAYGVGLFYSRTVSYKLISTKGNPKILFHLFAAILMSILLYFIDFYFVIFRWYHLLAVGLIGLLFYFFILAILKEFKKEDFFFFLDTLNIKKMFDYIKEEIKKK